MNVNRFADDLFANFLALRPDLAANLGISSVGASVLPADTLADYSETGFDQLRQLASESSKKLTQLSVNSLSQEEELTFQVLDYILNHGAYFVLPGRAGHDFLDPPYPLTHLDGFHADTLTLLTRDHAINSLEQAQDYLQRVACLPEAAAATASLLKKRTEKDVITPAVLVSRSLDDLTRFFTSNIQKNILYKDLKNKLLTANIVNEPASALLAQLETVLREKVYPAYQLVMDELKIQLAKNKQKVGAWALPKGDDYYAWRLRACTTTDMTPGEIHDLGLREIERLHREIRKAFEKQGINKENVADMYRKLGLLENSRYTNSPDDRHRMLSDAQEIVADMKVKCRELFNIWPRAQAEVIPIADELEASLHSTYSPNRDENESAAVFQLNLGITSKQLKWELPLICYHEVYPGHHLQLSIARELNGLPLFRQYMLFQAYLEGWAKYAETIPLTYQFTNEPLIALFRLRSELYSTVNLALDTGLHWKCWSRDTGISFFVDNTGVERSFAEYVVDRVIATPGKVCAYKVGMLKVLELLERFKKAKGKEFELRDFHDTILKHGALPLKILDSVVNKALEKPYQSAC